MHLDCKNSRTNNSDDENINLLDYLEIAVKYWRIIAKTTISAFVISIIITFLLPKIYSSTARILPPQQDNMLMGLMMSQMGGVASLAGDLLGKGTAADLYVGILKSESVKDAIIDKFDLQKVYGKDYRYDTYKELDENVNILAGKKDGIISITVEDEDPKRAAQIANEFVQELEKLTNNLNITGALESKAFLEGRLSITKNDLIKAEDNLKAFQSKNKTLDIAAQSKASVELIAQFMAQLAAEEVRLATLQKSFVENSPEVKNSKTAISSIKKQIAKLEGTINDGAVTSIGAAPSLGQEYLRLMREFKIQESLLEILTKQYEMAKLTEAKDVKSIQIIQVAKPSDKKSKPKRSLIVLAITAAAFLSALFISYILEYCQRMPGEDRQRWRLIYEQLRRKK